MGSRLNFASSRDIMYVVSMKADVSVMIILIIVLYTTTLSKPRTRLIVRERHYLRVNKLELERIHVYN